MSSTDSIFLLNEDGELTRLDREVYDAEDLLQRLLVDYPELLSGEQIDPVDPRRWLLLSREQGVRDDEGSGYRWSVDHLFLDQDAIPTLVEVKRSSDTRIRREVVGQMLDYAANAVSYWTLDDLRNGFRSTCEAAGADPSEVLRDFLAESGSDPEDFWSRAKTNLQAGRLRLLFVADEIPSDLRRIVEFLNEQMDPAQVLAVEVPRFAGSGLQTLTPRVVGRTAAAENRKASGTRSLESWTPEKFRRIFLERQGREMEPILDRILAWSAEHLPRPWYGSGTTNASFTPALEIDGESCWLFGLYASGALEIKFQYLLRWPPFDNDERRLELRRRLEEIPGVQIPEDRIETRPSFDVKLLLREGALERFLDAMKWCVGEVHARAAGH